MLLSRAPLGSLFLDFTGHSVGNLAHSEELDQTLLLWLLLGPSCALGGYRNSVFLSPSQLSVPGSLTWCWYSLKKKSEN